MSWRAILSLIFATVLAEARTLSHDANAGISCVMEHNPSVSTSLSKHLGGHDVHDMVVAQTLVNEIRAAAAYVAGSKGHATTLVHDGLESPWRQTVEPLYTYYASLQMDWASGISEAMLPKPCLCK